MNLLKFKQYSVNFFGVRIWWFGALVAKKRHENSKTPKSTKYKAK